MAALPCTTLESALRILIHVRNAHDLSRRRAVRSLIHLDIAQLRAERRRGAPAGVLP